MSDSIETFIQALAREKKARKSAERLLEEKSRELFSANQNLKLLNDSLEKEIDVRVADLSSAKKEAEKANQTKAHFLASMSHEMRTPLSAILGMTELLSSTGLTPEQALYVERLKVNGDSLLHLIEDILDFSKLEAGAMRAQLIPFDPIGLVEEVGQMLSGRAFSAGLELIVDADPEIPSSLVGDRHRIHQLLVNLVSNAIKFSAKEGVSVVVQLSILKQTPETATVRYEVQDHGIGLSEEDQKNIFSKFYRSKEVIERHIPGTGLGLSICKSLVDMMNGKIGVESVLGKGSKFFFEISHRLSPDQGVSVRAPRDLQQTRILLLEDEPRARAGTARLLTHLRASVIAASSAADALVQLAKGQDPHLILCDDSLPGVSIADVIKAWSDDPMLADLPLVALSSSGLDRLRELLEVGAPYVVPKPVTQRSLHGAITKAIGRNPSTARAKPNVETSSPFQKALLVEDDPDNRRLLQRMLESFGLLVTICADGKEAIALFESQDFDIVVTDLSMPYVDGFALSKHIRSYEKEQQRQEIPILVVTAHALPGYREKSIACGINEYITKPVSKHRLLSALDRLIDRRPTLLIAEDSLDQQALLKNYLRSVENIRVVFASNGERALEIANTQRISALVVDMEMPILDGHSTIQRLRADRSTRHLPIIAMTAHTDPAERKRCFVSGCTSFLQKPVDKDKLLQALDPYLAIPPFLEQSTSPQETAPIPTEESSIPMEIMIPPDLQDLIPGYIANRTKDLERALHCLEENDYLTLARLGHGMKGSGAAYGLPGFTEIGSRLEGYAKKNDGTNSERTLAELKSYLDTVVEKLRSPVTP